MAKTVEELIFSVRANQVDNTNFRYKTGTTTSSGNAGGTTFIDSGLSSFVDDFFNGCHARITNSGFSKLKEILITDFTSSTGTVTVAETFGGQILNTYTYEIFEKSVWTDPQIIEWLNSELSSLAHLLDDKVAASLIKKETVAGASGVLAIPDDMIRLIGIETTDGSGTVTMLHPTQRDRFNDDDTASEAHRVVIPSGATSVDGNNIFGTYQYKPTDVESFDFYYIPKLADLTTSQDLQAPNWLADLLVLGATVRGFMASDDFDKAREFRGYRDDFIALANRQQIDKEVA